MLSLICCSLAPKKPGAMSGLWFFNNHGHPFTIPAGVRRVTGYPRTHHLPLLQERHPQGQDLRKHLRPHRLSQQRRRLRPQGALRLQVHDERLLYHNRYGRQLHGDSDVGHRDDLRGILRLPLLARQGQPRVSINRRLRPELGDEYHPGAPLPQPAQDPHLLPGQRRSRQGSPGNPQIPPQRPSQPRHHRRLAVLLWL